jgi:hypothetical protein
LRDETQNLGIASAHEAAIGFDNAQWVNRINRGIKHAQNKKPHDESCGFLGVSVFV